uniref:hypothetical protein n=1 Tax=Candidatus Ichthyocystis hellenicum TaxID=1561003 RepID=UPI001584B61A
GPSDDDVTDQADSGGLQQVQTLPGGGLGVATVAAVSTVTTTSSAVTTSVAAPFTATTTSTSATTSVGKGSSGSRGTKGKGPASKGHASAAASTSAAASVGKGVSGGSKKGKGPASKGHASGASPKLAGRSTSSRTIKCCGFDVCASDWVELRRMEDNFLCAVEEKAATFFRSRIQDLSLSSGAFSITDISGSRDELFSDLEVSISSFVGEYLEEVHSRVVSSFHLLAGEVKKFSANEADRFRASFFAIIVVRIRECLAPAWSSEISRALDRALGAAPDRAQIAARVAARATATAAVAARARARAAVPIPDTEPDPARARARVCAYVRAADSRARAAAAVAAAVADPAIDLDRAVAADRAVVNRARSRTAARAVARARTAVDADPGSNPYIDPSLADVLARAAAATHTCAATTHTCATTTTTTVAGSSTTSLPSDSSLTPSILVDLCGFEISSELSEAVSRLISEILVSARNFYPNTIRVPVSHALRELSNPGLQRAWCLINMKLCETRFMAECVAEYCAKLLPGFISLLCSIRAGYCSGRSFSSLTGNMLSNFWAYLDQAIFKALRGFFVEKWAALTGHFSVPFFFPLDPEEGPSALCGGDFVGACARGAGTSLSSGSRFASIARGMAVQVAPHGGGGYVDLFGSEVLPEVREMVDALIREVSALARRIYSSVVRVQVLDAMSRLSYSEQCAWLVANMMLYKIGFVARCLAEYHDGLCPAFVCSLFSIRPGDVSGRSLLSLAGNDLRGFWLSLCNAITRAVEDIFVTDWEALTRRFSVLLEPGEESSSTVLCGRDFVNACNRAGVPPLAVSGSASIMRGRVAQSAVSHIAAVASSSSASVAAGSSVAGLLVSGAAPQASVVTEGSGDDDVTFVDNRSSVSERELGGRPSSSLSEGELVIDVSTPSRSEPLVLVRGEEVGLSMVGTTTTTTSSSSALGVLGDRPSPSPSGRMVVLTTSGPFVVPASAEVGESPTIPRRGSSGGPSAPKKSFMSRHRADVISSSGMSSSSMSSSSSVAAGSLSSASVGVGSVSSVTTTTVAATAYTYSGSEDVGTRLAALMNRGLPHPPPASESAPTVSEASSSGRVGGRGKRKRKKKS